MSQEETVTVRYLVICGKHTPDGFREKFDYSAQAPPSLCKPHNDNEPGPDPDATGVFITSLIDRHNEEILCSRVWRCVTCGKRAKNLLHSAVPILSPNAERATADFEPTILDNATPICVSGGACDRNAEKMVQDFAKNNLIQRPWQELDLSKTCDKCGKKSGVKVCSGCKLIAYCSKECQAQSWPTHKKQCRRAQATTNKGS
ncbi:hypothetical protein N431DRAFT_556319 [Stipitochalara longipes BDJ]|nr:hypothetical protein N431DRAFT_556319 [Stipitochalara longipes BDJ]